VIASIMLHLLLVEDNERLRHALRQGLEATALTRVVAEFATGEEAVSFCRAARPDAVLMDVALAGEMNGVRAAATMRREHPRLPVVFYSIQDDDRFYRDFLQAGLLTHYAYVRKSNYLLPGSILTLLRDAVAGKSFVDPEIEARVQEVRHRDEHDPLALLEPNEREVVGLLAQGYTNQQIAGRLGYADKRAVARANGQIYAAWRLNETPTDEKVARTRAALIYRRGQLMIWDDNGEPQALDRRGAWVPIDLTE
jgi:DNA-binding NarL/FixJ family response regulator